eukprot:CAMPEP_0197064554 /NCGR_PEP_ID=MMETSP1384-20130603/160153_1 /TAXON_ID=29189 /ORGANISM="Ammonia sp." /LENGTH=248 /DNA_ID=CAMNT_0042501111 /DNA_START=23 /DNA_END=766 /DNA_ORIENTATION=+
MYPSQSPSKNPTNHPTLSPTKSPLADPTKMPSVLPSRSPTQYPTSPDPTRSPTKGPTSTPSAPPTPTTREWEGCIEDFRLFTTSDSSETDAGLLSLDFDSTDSALRLRLSGPSAKWFAVGFGSHVMENTYAVIIAGQFSVEVSQRVLGEHHSGYPVQDGIEVEASWDDAISRNVSIVMDWFHMYDFSDFLLCRLDTLPIIWAHGYDTSFGYHGAYQTSTLQLASCGCEVLPTAAPLASPTSAPSEKVL